jgi:hypothetical protein
MGFALAAKEGFITGGGPSEPDKLQNRMRTGWKPYSVHVGDQYISYQRLEPFASILGMAADFVEVADEKTSGDKANKIVGTIMSNFADASFLRGVADFSAAWHDPKRYASEFVRGLAESTVPNIVAKTAQAIDPVSRETKALSLDPIINRIPGLSKTLPERKAGTGETQMKQGASAIERFASPFSRSADKGPAADLERIFEESDFIPSRPPREVTIQGSGGRKVELTQEERDFLAKADEKVTERLRRAVQSSEFKRLDPVRKKSFLRSQYQRAGDRAMQQLRAYPAFRARAARAVRESRSRA